ncbi:hypothetical protein ACVXRV_004337, partial [Enterobacter roggenkampii]
ILQIIVLFCNVFELKEATNTRLFCIAGKRRRGRGAAAWITQYDTAQPPSLQSPTTTGLNATIPPGLSQSR